MRQSPPPCCGPPLQKLLPRGRSSKSAFTPPSTYRARQSTIVGRDVFSSLAKALLDRPSAAPRIIRARSAWRCSVLPERTILSSSALSSAVIASAVLLAHMPHSIAGPRPGTTKNCASPAAASCRSVAALPFFRAPRPFLSIPRRPKRRGADERIRDTRQPIRAALCRLPSGMLGIAAFGR